MNRYLQISLYVFAGVIVGIALQLLVLHKYIKLPASKAVADSTMVVSDTLNVVTTVNSDAINGIPTSNDTINSAPTDSTDARPYFPTSMIITQLFQQDPVLLYKVEPEYPDSLKQARKEGVVVLDVEVLPDGTVGELSVAETSQSGSIGFDEAAKEVVKKYIYQPFVVNGVPIKFWIKQTIRFEVTN